MTTSTQALAVPCCSMSSCCVEGAVRLPDKSSAVGLNSTGSENPPHQPVTTNLVYKSHIYATHTHTKVWESWVLCAIWYKWLWLCLLPTTGLIPRSFWCSCLWIIKHEGVTFAFKREVATGCQFSFTAEQVEQPSAPLMLTVSLLSPQQEQLKPDYTAEFNLLLSSHTAALLTKISCFYLMINPETCFRVSWLSIRG